MATLTKSHPTRIKNDNNILKNYENLVENLEQKFGNVQKVKKSINPSAACEKCIAKESLKMHQNNKGGQLHVPEKERVEKHALRQNHVRTPYK